MDLLSKKYTQAEEIRKLKEENAVLQAYKDVNEDFKKAWEELKAENEKLDQENKELFNDKLKLNDLVKELRTDNEWLKEENEKLKEKTIELTEENGNLIIRANTSYNNYKDTQRRLDELCKANIHNLALLSKTNKTLQEIKAIATGVRSYLNIPAPRDVRYEMDRILNLITKAEEV